MAGMHLADQGRNQLWGRGGSGPPSFCPGPPVVTRPGPRFSQAPQFVSGTAVELHTADAHQWLIVYSICSDYNGAELVVKTELL